MQRTNLDSGWEQTLVCSATGKITIRPGRYPRRCGYTPILFPPGKARWRPARPPSFLSGREGIFECLANDQFCFRQGRYCAVLRYPQVLCPAGKGLAGSGYSPIVFPAGKGFWRATLAISSLCGWEEIFECVAKEQFSFRLGSYCGVLRYPPVPSPAGEGSCRFWLLTNCLSGWKRTLECCASHQFSLRPGRDLAVCR